MLGVNDIFKYIPHRYPFLLVDRILEIQGEEKIVGIKNVTINEQFLSRPFSAPAGDAGSVDLRSDGASGRYFCPQRARRHGGQPSFCAHRLGQRKV